MKPPFVTKKDSKEGRSVETKVDLNEILKIPNAGVGSAPFEIPAEFTGLIVPIDAHLAELFKGKLDAGNGNVLDNLIDEAADKALEDCREQYAAHLGVIESLNAQRGYDFDITRRALDIDKAKRADIEAQVKRLCSIIIEKDGVTL